MNAVSALQDDKTVNQTGRSKKRSLCAQVCKCHSSTNQHITLETTLCSHISLHIGSTHTVCQTSEDNEIWITHAIVAT